MKPILIFINISLLVPLAALHLYGAPNSDFDRKAAALFTTNYFYHVWNETDHTVDGEDWSLPRWVRQARYSRNRSESGIAGIGNRGRSGESGTRESGTFCRESGTFCIID